ncbi:MAG TPA: hypothetical protein VGL56_14080 [Fimbriimonadaceae bacterium]
MSQYDPEEDEGRKRTAYISAREWRVIGIVFVVVCILMVPVYNHFMDLRNSHICTQNLLDIGTAVEGYMEDNNERLPPVYATADDGIEPRVFDKKAVFSWVSLLTHYMNKTEAFSCPAAIDSEGVQNLPSSNGPNVTSDYGMYAALSAFPRDSISSPGSVALVVDSSNEGSNGTYDPLPFKDSSGNLIPDGFVVGLNTTNFTPADSTQTKYDSAKFATRVASPDSAKMGFSSKSYTRHPDGINVLMADLHREHISADRINAEHPGGVKGHGVIGLWAIP